MKLELIGFSKKTTKALKKKIKEEIKKTHSNTDYNDRLEEMFKGCSIYSSDFPDYDGTMHATVHFDIETKEYNRLKKAKALGGVYNRDLSNYLYRKGMVTKGVPSVDESQRSKHGYKRITVTFELR